MTTPEPPNGADREPLRRPDLERTEPIRNIFNAFRQEDGRGKAPFADDPVWSQFQGQATADPVDTSWKPGPLWKSAGESVQAGYRVLNQQVEEGRSAAQTFGAGAQGLRGKGVPEILNRLVRTYSDVGTVWVDLLIAATERAPDEPARQPTAAATPGGAPSVGGAVAVELTASGPVTARARLYRAVSGPLSALPLRGVGPGAVEISEVSVEPGPLIRLNVAAGTPPGQYHGIVLEEGAEEPAGSVSVTVHG